MEIGCSMAQGKLRAAGTSLDETKVLIIDCMCRRLRQPNKLQHPPPALQFRVSVWLVFTVNIRGHLVDSQCRADVPRKR